jgi:hypothetical protein
MLPRMLVLGLLLALGEPAPPESIAIIDLKPAAATDAAAAQLLTDAIVQAIAAEHKGPVTSLREIKDRIGVQAEARLLGCDDETCVADVSKGLSTDLFVSGRAGILQGQLLVFLSLIETRTGAVRSRASKIVPPGGATKAMKEATQQLQSQVEVAAKQTAHALLIPDAIKDGDQPLKDLRLAVLFDEYDMDGQPAKLRAVETCVQKKLMDAEAELVSAAVVQRVKGKAGPRKLLEGGVPDDVTSDEVDALLVGVVDRKPLSFNGTPTGTELAASVQLLRVDSGDVLASEQVTARFPSTSPTEAMAKSAERACEKLRPAIEGALAKRASRGSRLVLEVDALSTPEAANDLAKKLDKLERVARVKVRKVDAKKSILDVTLKGGDGIAFALELASVLTVTEAASGTIKAKLPA